MVNDNVAEHAESLKNSDSIINCQEDLDKNQQDQADTISQCLGIQKVGKDVEWNEFNERLTKLEKQMEILMKNVEELAAPNMLQKFVSGICVFIDSFNCTSM